MFFKKPLVVLIISMFIVGMIVSLTYVIRRYIFDIEEPYYATVIDAKWSVVALDSDKKVTLAGIYIPDTLEDGPNPIPEQVDNIGKILIDKKVKIELMERYRTGAPNKSDLVRVYLEDGTCVNTYLLENGMAFFSHGYYRNKEREIEAEARAKKAKKGIWSKKLDLLYVGSKDWEGVHYPECPEVKKIKPESRIEYYNRPVAVHWYRDWDPECPYCDEIKKTKPEHLK